MENHDEDAPNLEPFPSNVAHDLNDVMLDLMVFQQAAKQLNFKPSVDLFGNAQHHQVDRYLAYKRDAELQASMPFRWIGSANGSRMPNSVPTNCAGA